MIYRNKKTGQRVVPQFDGDKVHILGVARDLDAATFLEEHEPYEAPVRSTEVPPIDPPSTKKPRRSGKP